MQVPPSRRLLSAAIGILLAAAGITASASIAVADTASRVTTTTPDDTASTTVSADPLPTVQVNGVVWKQLIVGDTVFAGGEFTSARPAGAALGTDEVPRGNILAYNLQTGDLITSFAPVFNAKIHDMAVSPDHTKLIVVGDFTQVDGQTRNHVAIFDLPSGVLSSVAPNSNGVTNSVAATNSTVYLGGYFSYLNSTARARLGAVSLSTGATLPFQVPVDDGQVQSIVVSSDASQLVFAGNFTSVGGSSNPGYGIARVDAVTGAMLPLPVNSEFRDAGQNSGVLRLASDGNYFYGVGWTYGQGGSSEGTFKASWSDGSLYWLEDCHGDTYDVSPQGDAVYAVGHKHYCGNSGGFPQSNPWVFRHSVAWSNNVAGTNTADIYGYPDHPGTPRPELLNWFPNYTVGTYTGQDQATWTVTSNDQYVVVGGEFPKVNGKPQQGIVRFAVRSIAPNKSGPVPPNGSGFDPVLKSLSPGKVRVSWPASTDRDDKTLTYQVYRDTNTNLVYQTTQTAYAWNVKPMTWTDTGLTPGSTVRYRVRVLDPWGNLVNSSWATITVATADAMGAYGNAVVDDGATKFWRLDEPTGTAVADDAGSDDTTAGTGVTRNTPGAMTNSSNAAATFSGTSSGVVVSTQQVTAPNTFTEEVWFKTTTTRGGKIAGFGDKASGNSSSYDRHLYMDTSGRLNFGVFAAKQVTISSAAGLNDGAWHQAVASLGPSGMALYIDGKKVAFRQDVTAAQTYSGYWRVGGDSTWSGQQYFPGAIDDFSVYPTELTAQQVNQHWIASGRASALPPAPSDSLGQAIFNSGPEIYWRLGETGGTVAADSSPVGSTPGTYAGSKTLGRSGVTSANGAVQLLRQSNTSGGNLTATKPWADPLSFTEEIWLKTTATTGGRIIGFGSSGTASKSSSYDRSVQMLDSGKLRFVVKGSSQAAIDSTAALNDGVWHQVVATRDTDGIKLYVDGVLDASAPGTTVGNYTGYWKLGGDNVFAGSTSQYLQTDLDEAAVYSRALSLAEVKVHYRAGGGILPNAAPTAAFTTDTAYLDATFDGSGSTDSDGTVASYAWSFGDGSVATGTTPHHTYAEPGDYDVTLTVTDDLGATDQMTHTVTVTAPPPNQPPNAAFTAAVTDLAVAFDGSASVDSDGSIESYAWDFGDGTSGTGRSPQHSYAAAGTYQVTLTVSDDDGGTDHVSQAVTTTAPYRWALDRFDRTVTDGWGTAGTGGVWTSRGGSASARSVGGGAGQLSVSNGAFLNQDLSGVSASAAAVTVEFSVDKVLEGTYVGVTGRQVGSDSYLFRLRLAADGSAKLYMLRNNDTQIGSVYNLPAGSIVAGEHYFLSGQVDGVSPTTLSAKVWKASDPEPAVWQRTGTDSTATLQAPGAIGVFAYLPTSTGGGPVVTSFYRLEAIVP